LLKRNKNGSIIVVAGSIGDFRSFTGKAMEKEHRIQNTKDKGNYFEGK